MDAQEIIYRLALRQVNGIGSVRYKKLLSTYGSATSIFERSKHSLEPTDGIGVLHWKAIRSFVNFKEAEKEFDYIQAEKIGFLAIDQDNYPSKLKRAVDAPPYLFYRGDASIHNTRVVAIVGTRSCSDYGKQMCEQIVEQLAPSNPLIISGLAYGIDSIAHSAALRLGLSTVGVMATGLDKVYPAQNKKIARAMQHQGGLLTEFYSGSLPDKENFPLRNRIVAGLADATIVIETPKKGGSMITANLAHSYNRDVFCIPARVGDKRSAGCLELIKSLQASMITCGEDVLVNMNWDDEKKLDKVPQRKLFVELSKNERLVYDILDREGVIHIDKLFAVSLLSMSMLSSLLLQLEMNGLIRSLPGKLYQAV